MDFDRINVFNQIKFELGSKIRNRRFRFIRYTGNNYGEIVSYIKKISPNTEIWPEDKLKTGTLYNYSGRDFRMNYVDDLGLRAVIVNNPFIIIDNDWIPLAISNVEAEEYLSLDSKHSVYRPNKPFSTYRKDNGSHSIIEYNPKEHRKGLEFEKLQPNVEYFVCNDVVSQADCDMFIYVYDSDFHELQITPDIHNMVDEIEKLKYQINGNCLTESNTLFFAPTWDNWEKRRTMAERCHKSEHMMRIVESIHGALMNETQADGILGKQLSIYKVNNHTFIQDIKDLVSCRFDSVHSTTNQKNVFLKYLNNADGPLCPNDYQTLQIAIYHDYISFLKTVMDITRKPKDGYIQEDEEGNLFCCDVQISSDNAIYKGCRCRIVNYEKNYNKRNKYKYYSKCIDTVNCHWSGVVKSGMRGTKVVNNYLVPDNYKVSVGDSVIITQIQPYPHKRIELYAGVIKELKTPNEDECGKYVYSPIRSFVLVKDVDKFLKYLHELIDKQKNFNKRIFILRAACVAGKIESPYGHYKEYDEEFPNMFGTSANWSKYLDQKKFNDEIKKFTRYFNNW